ncbi:hypothetical protein CEJ63_25545, partial [Acinetobacter baumannii]
TTDKQGLCNVDGRQEHRRWSVERRRALACCGIEIGCLAVQNEDGLFHGNSLAVSAPKARPRLDWLRGGDAWCSLGEHAQHGELAEGGYAL